MAHRLAALIVVTLGGVVPLLAPASPPDPQVLIYNTEGNRLRRYDVDTIDTGLVEDVLQPSASDDPVNGRDSNGAICRFRERQPLGVYVLGIVIGANQIDFSRPDAFNHRLSVFFGS